jgi:hypothetical protein
MFVSLGDRAAAGSRNICDMVTVQPSALESSTDRCYRQDRRLCVFHTESAV